MADTVSEVLTTPGFKQEQIDIHTKDQLKPEKYLNQKTCQ